MISTIILKSAFYSCHTKRRTRCKILCLEFFMIFFLNWLFAFISCNCNLKYLLNIYMVNWLHGCNSSWFIRWCSLQRPHWVTNFFHYSFFIFTDSNYYFPGILEIYKAAKINFSQQSRTYGLSNNVYYGYYICIDISKILLSKTCVLYIILHTYSSIIF